MRKVMWKCPYCSKSIPLAMCIVGIFDSTGGEFNGEMVRFYHLVCPYCGEEDSYILGADNAE